MSIVEQTKSMLDVLPASDAKVIYLVTKQLFEKSASPFQPLTRSQIMADLALSEEQYTSGDYQDFDDVIAEVEADYGL